eukprot:CAMPEP_0194296118 /NCGR_PEP_ID=MMETSP0169-20130528/55218_1 /TAXON_ID=218684 /ORGANISM="Corethron pennatum, Strain L29A3" /LENGTH=148 /DNA_ID=CAMNT_0039045487 /DNA_START=208 /DNA_END=655 /DNA_ORIENTATION=-
MFLLFSQPGDAAPVASAPAHLPQSPDQRRHFLLRVMRVQYDPYSLGPSGYRRGADRVHVKSVRRRAPQGRRGSDARGVPGKQHGLDRGVPGEQRAAEAIVGPGAVRAEPAENMDEAEERLLLSSPLDPATESYEQRTATRECRSGAVE